MKNIVLAGALGLASLSPIAVPQASAQTVVLATPGGGAASPIDRRFATQAATSNTFEVRSSQMALRKSHDPEVRTMARWMIQSHTASERKLLSDANYADYLGGAAPVETPMTADILANLATLDGAAFDKAYVDAQVDGHALTAQQMQDYALQGSYAPLLRYEAATLPDVEDHLAHFRALQARMAGATRFTGEASF